MVEVFDEGEDWTAVQNQAPATMMMQQQDAQDGDAFDAFADAGIQQAAPVLLQTASGAQ